MLAALGRQGLVGLYENGELIVQRPVAMETSPLAGTERKPPGRAPAPRSEQAKKTAG